MEGEGVWRVGWDVEDVELVRGDREGLFRVDEVVDLERCDLDGEAHEFAGFFVEDELGVVWFQGVNLYSS